MTNSFTEADLEQTTLLWLEELGYDILPANDISSNDKEIKTLQQIRDSLLPKLMSGEIDVKS